MITKRPSRRAGTTTTRRVAIDLSWSTRPGFDRGLGRYARQALQAISDLGWSTVDISTKPRSTRIAEGIDALERTARAQRSMFDLLHAFSPYQAAFGVRERVVVSILDLIPLEVPGHRKTGLKAQYFHRWATRRADALLTISEYTAGRIVDLFGVPRDKIIVAPCYPALAFGETDRASARGDDAYAVSLIDVRTPDPRKRLPWLIGVGGALDRFGYKLVLAGAGTDEIRADGVVGVGRLADDDLATLYRDAAVFVCSSMSEGQGLPPLEAIASGTPVVAFANTALPEVVGSAGVLVPEPTAGSTSPDNHRAIATLAEATLAVLADAELRESLAAHCSSQASRFSRARMAEGFTEAYEGRPR